MQNRTVHEKVDDLMDSLEQEEEAIFREDDAALDEIVFSAGLPVMVYGYNVHNKSIPEALDDMEFTHRAIKKADLQLVTHEWIERWIARLRAISGVRREE